MKKHKFNLLGILPPKGWRFVKYREDFQDGDTYWNSDAGFRADYTIRGGYDHGLCGYHYPLCQEGVYKGYVRKIS